MVHARPERALEQGAVHHVGEGLLVRGDGVVCDLGSVDVVDDGLGPVAVDDCIGHGVAERIARAVALNLVAARREVQEARLADDDGDGEHVRVHGV